MPDRNSAIGLEFCEEVCNERASAIEVMLEKRLPAVIRFSRDNSEGTLSLKSLADLNIGSLGLIGDQECMPVPSNFSEYK
jgi:hypothetical protein